MAIEIVDFPSYKMVDLSIATLNYQRVMGTSPQVGYFPQTYGVISQHYGVVSWNHDRIDVPLFLLLMDLQSPWRKGVLYCSGYWDHLFVSQAYAWWAMVPQPSQPLTFGNVIVGCPASIFPGYAKKRTSFGNPALFLYATSIWVYIYIIVIYIYNHTHIYI